MEVLVAVGGVAVLAGLAVSTAVVGFRLWRAGADGERDLLLHRVLKRKGLNLDGRTDDATLGQMAAATRTCLLCRDRGTCLAWLEGDASVPLEHFCPNADLLARLQSERQAASPGSV